MKGKPKINQSGQFCRAEPILWDTEFSCSTFTRENAAFWCLLLNPRNLRVQPLFHVYEGTVHASRSRESRMLHSPLSRQGLRASCRWSAWWSGAASSGHPQTRSKPKPEVHLLAPCSLHAHCMPALVLGTGARAVTCERPVRGGTSRKGALRTDSGLASRRLRSIRTGKHQSARDQPITMWQLCNA